MGAQSKVSCVCVCGRGDGGDGAAAPRGGLTESEMK